MKKIAAIKVTVQNMKSLKLLGTVEVFEEKIKKQLEESWPASDLFETP